MVSAMEEVIFTRSVLPAGFEQVDLNSKNLHIAFADVNSPFYVNAGDPILTLKYKREDGYLLLEDKITSSCDGIIDYSHLFVFSGGTRATLKVFEGNLLYKFYTLEEYVSKTQYPFTIEEDDFSGVKGINWDFKDAGYKNVFVLERDKAFIHLGILPGWPTLTFYIRKYYCDSRPRQNDTLYFLFEDRSTLSLPIKERVVVYEKDYYRLQFKLSQEDLWSLQTHSVQKIKVSIQDGKDVIIDNKTNSFHAGVRGLLLKKYANTYSSALDEYGFKWPDKREVDSKIQSPSLIDEPCFVYLMLDTTNGFYKIGISNNPEYREKTLQSEKPTIELLAAKPFPSRIIAEAIESALHKAYGDKRLRGEWFELDGKDVADILATLK
jgi:hypothetical protein